MDTSLFPKKVISSIGREIKRHPANLVMTTLITQYVLMGRGLSSNTVWKFNKDFLR